MTEQTEKMYYPVKLSQDETDYESYMVRRNPVAQACANCRWFAAPMDCYLVECEPLPILPTGWCNRWESMPQEKEETMIEEIVEALEDAAEVGMMERKPGIVDRLKALLPKRPTEPFTAFKMITDDLALVVFTNNFRDKDNEIIKGKALDDMFLRMQQGFVPMPEFWHAHIPGTKHGKSVWIDKAGDHFGYAVIRLDDTPAAKEAAKTYKRLPRGSFTISHGFTYPKWARKTIEIDGEKVAVYESLNTFEISTLLPGQEANPYTAFVTLEELNDMPMTEAKEAQIRALFGKQADTILSEVERMEQSGKALADIGAKYKEFVEAEPTETETTNKAATEATGSLLADVLSFQGDTAKALQGVEGFTKKEIEAIRTEMKQYAEVVNEMKRLMEMPATPASESASTVVDIPAGTGMDMKNLQDMLDAMKAKEQIEQKQSPVEEFDPFYGDLKVKKR